MDSTVPILAPSASTMVAPCQLRTVSRSGMCILLSLLLWLVAGGWGGRGSATMRQALPRADPVSAAASVGAAGTELLGGARVDDGAAALGLVGLDVLVAVGRGGRGRSPSLLAKFGATLLGPAGGSAPVALHGLDPTTTDGDHGRADHDGQDRIPQAGHDPGGDLQLVQGGKGPKDQDRDAGPLGHDLPAGDAGEQVGQQIG